MVRVEEPLPAILVGAKLAVAPEGNPVILSLTVPINPSVSAVEITTLALDPAVAVWDSDEAEIEKSPTGVTGKWWILPAR